MRPSHRTGHLRRCPACNPRSESAESNDHDLYRPDRRQLLINIGKQRIRRHKRRLAADLQMCLREAPQGHAGVSPGVYAREELRRCGHRVAASVGRRESQRGQRRATAFAKTCGCIASASWVCLGRDPGERRYPERIRAGALVMGERLAILRATRGSPAEFQKWMSASPRVTPAGMSGKTDVWTAFTRDGCSFYSRWVYSAFSKRADMIEQDQGIIIAYGLGVLVIRIIWGHDNDKTNEEGIMSVYESDEVELEEDTMSDYDDDEVEVEEDIMSDYDGDESDVEHHEAVAEHEDIVSRYRASIAYFASLPKRKELIKMVPLVRYIPSVPEAPPTDTLDGVIQRLAINDNPWEGSDLPDVVLDHHSAECALCWESFVAPRRRSAPVADDAPATEPLRQLPCSPTHIFHTPGLKRKTNAPSAASLGKILSFVMLLLPN
ncbi:hypothetical protein WOLCODRAFT_153368 [Wolfiporia cocos MD-104 SS10]|uniref:Uncharacterized protein n=1 Tax=Wolfiporia cocos (strain MD-104) TaxID=742152 RepID=A0A2H3K4G3_WOLCO|nr:hypothetical protein WOLCODRAFT_153368 [Wolfiporia cocos MD-104 SS10]